MGHRNGIISTALLVLAFSSGVLTGISDSCLNCLSMIFPVEEDSGCFTYGKKVSCGMFRISDGFFKDCRRHFTPPPGLDDFRNCSLNYDCAAQCVKMYHNNAGPTCLAAIRLNDPDYKELTCFDYGKMHANGPHGCGVDKSDSAFWQRYKQNMTELCGCKVLYGSCTTTMQIPSSTASSGPTTEQLILYTVPAACGLLLIVFVIFGAILLHHYAKGQRQKAELEYGRVQLDAEEKHVVAISNKEYQTPASDDGKVVRNSDLNNVYDQAVAANLKSSDGDKEVTTMNMSSRPPDYVNSADVASSFDPPYINGRYQQALWEESKKWESLCSKAPVALPRDTESTKNNGSSSNKMPSGLYVEEVNVGDDFLPSKDQYVIPELEEHYHNHHQLEGH